MFNQPINPKYIKTVKIGFIQRLMNGFMTFVNYIFLGLHHLVRSPFEGVTAFCRKKYRAFDQDLYDRDMFEKMEEEGEDGQPTLRLEVRQPDDDEDWKKAHKEEYGD